MIEESVGIVPSLVRNWARVYTFGLPSEIREARRAEIESDLWEHAHDSELGGDAPSPFCALHALVRLLAGVPDGLLWRIEQAKSHSMERDSHILSINVSSEVKEMTTIRETTLPNRLYQGKVRDTYDLGDGLLLMVATDRISAFDVVLPTGIPEKGAVLTQISEFWFDMTKDIIPNHFVCLATDRDDLGISDELARRSMVVKRADRIDVECIVRGFITGSAWGEYRRTGTVAGQPMPEGLQDGDMFPEPLFTPSTKAEEGHDENITVAQMEDMVGKELTERLSKASIEVYSTARDYAREKGIIIADTKFEFGIIDGEISLIDEVLTPDSSRFWDVDGYAPGKSQPSYDKQYVRDWLDAAGWDHEPPAPELPDDVVASTRARYLEAYEKLTGNALS